jgi:hypothetical protein
VHRTLKLVPVSKAIQQLILEDVVVIDRIQVVVKSFTKGQRTIGNDRHIPLGPTRLLTHKEIRLTVQNKKRVLFGKREVVLSFPPFIAESEQAVIKEKVCKGALLRSLIDRTPDADEGLFIEALGVDYRSYAAELRNAVLLVFPLPLKFLLCSLEKARGQCIRPRHRLGEN